MNLGEWEKSFTLVRHLPNSMTERNYNPKCRKRIAPEIQSDRHQKFGEYNESERQCRYGLPTSLWSLPVGFMRTRGRMAFMSYRAVGGLAGTQEERMAGEAHAARRQAFQQPFEIVARDAAEEPTARPHPF